MWKLSGYVLLLVFVFFPVLAEYADMGWYTYVVHFEERGGGCGLASVLDVQSLFLLLKKIGF